RPHNPLAQHFLGRNGQHTTSDKYFPRCEEHGRCSRLRELPAGGLDERWRFWKSGSERREWREGQGCRGGNLVLQVCK
ncbi:hypothetical protein HDU93_005792, partial [Gonapodya sp. JEL0774]